jgi:DNA-binding MarR family transcriptional regulator
LNALTLVKAGKYQKHANRKPRSQRSKYRVLEILIERGTITSEELADILTMTVHAISKVTQSLTASGFIVRAEDDGQYMHITKTGFRVWEEAKRERLKWQESYSNLDFAQEPKQSNGANVG